MARRRSPTAETPEQIERRRGWFAFRKGGMSYEEIAAADEAERKPTISEVVAGVRKCLAELEDDEGAALDIARVEDMMYGLANAANAGDVAAVSLMRALIVDRRKLAEKLPPKQLPTTLSPMLMAAGGLLPPNKRKQRG